MGTKRRSRRRPRGFWIEVDGSPVHVNGDPDMDEQTLTALRAMVRAATTEMQRRAAARHPVEQQRRET